MVPGAGQASAQTDPAHSDEAARVRLGSSASAAPSVLGELASDPAVTVRAVVAMNEAAPRQIDRLLAHDPDERVRLLLARKLARLVPGLSGPRRRSLQQSALETLVEMVEDEAVRVRRAIAEAVKDMPEAPRDLILRLACDREAGVSEPVIRLSPLLTAEDLLGLVAAMPAAHTATAVARRPHLPEAVADAIAFGVDAGAVCALLANRSAMIREATLDALVARAAEQQEWHAPLVRRPALSARAAQALSEMVTSQLLDELAERADLPPAVTEELRRRVGERLAARTSQAAGEPNIDQALVEAQRMSLAQELDEEALLRAIQRGEARLAAAMLAVAAAVSISVIDRATTLRSAKGLVSLVWRAGFSMRVAGPAQMLLARLAPAAMLRAAAGGGFPLEVEEMRWQIDFLTRLGR